MDYSWFFGNFLSNDKIDIRCKIRIIHGLKDPVVPYENSIAFAKKVEGKDVKLYLEKNMNHDLTLENNLKTMEKVVNELINEL